MLFAFLEDLLMNLTSLTTILVVARLVTDSATRKVIPNLFILECLIIKEIARYQITQVIFDTLVFKSSFLHHYQSLLNVLNCGSHSNIAFYIL